MIDFLKECLWKNFAACIDMLKNAIELWPEEYWNSHKRFFFTAYHTIVFLDYYLTIPLEEFSALLPYTLMDFENIPEDAVDDVVPDKIYSKKESLEYVKYCREKCKSVIQGLTEETLQQQWINKLGSPDLSMASSSIVSYSVTEILLHNMRHVQHHAAQLNLLLRQTINQAPNYIFEVQDCLYD